MTIAMRGNFSQGSLLATFSKADARDLDSGHPTPKARLFFDFLGTIQKLPFRLQAKGEFDHSCETTRYGMSAGPQRRMHRLSSKGVSCSDPALYGQTVDC